MFLMSFLYTKLFNRDLYINSQITIIILRSSIFTEMKILHVLTGICQLKARGP